MILHTTLFYLLYTYTDIPYRNAQNNFIGVLVSHSIKYKDIEYNNI